MARKNNYLCNLYNIRTFITDSKFDFFLFNYIISKNPKRFLFSMF